MPETTTTKYRSCPTCEASCSLAVTVDETQNRIVSIRGNTENPYSRGYICAKSQAVNYVYEDPERLRRPVRKIDGDWVEVSWDDAFAFIASKLRPIREQYGKDAVAIYYGNPNGHNAGTNLYTPLFINVLNTERFFSPGTIDQQPKQIVSHLLYGDEWFFPVPDLERTDMFICMGGNPVVSQGSLMGAPNVKGRLEALKARGGHSVVIDPRRTETAVCADQHLFIRPGTDAVFLLAFLNEIFQQNRIKLGHLAGCVEGLEELKTLVQPYTPERAAPITGITPADLCSLVTRYCETERAVLYGRLGLCTQEFGTIATWLVDVINIVTGHFDREGGLMFCRPAHGQFEQTGEVTPLRRDRYAARSTGFPERCGQLPASHLGQELTYDGEDRVRAMITLAGNPVISVPNGKRIREGLEKTEFYVAIDLYINDTTSLADIILPPLQQLEHANYDLLWSTFASQNYASYSPAVLTPDPGGMAQWEIMLRLLEAATGMGWEMLDDLMAQGLADRVAKGVQRTYPDVTAETILETIGSERGFERYLDALLQAGPYGAKFGHRAGGLSLKALKAAGGFIDLGALQPRLPEMLRTEGQKLTLVHDYITSDFNRLETALGATTQEDGTFLLIGRRQIRDMNSWLHNIPTYVSGKPRCTLLVHPEDAERLSLTDAEEILIRSRTGEVRAPVKISDEIMPGVVSLPHGWGHRAKGARQSVANRVQPGVSANDLVDDMVLDVPSGTSVVNGVRVELVRPADEYANPIST